MKFLEILLSFITSQGKAFVNSNTETLSQHIVNNARRIFILISLTLISITLFCVGFSMAYRGLVIGYEHGDGWQWSASVIGGLILAVISALGLCRSLSEKSWMAATNIDTQNVTSTIHTQSGPTLESAFAILITEIALEIRERHKNAPETSNASSRDHSQV